jgi:hypothetical protein
MTLYINGTTGISGVDGSAATPALQGNDTNTGISFGSDVIIGSTGGVERFRVDSQGRLGIGTTDARGVLRLSGSSANAFPDNGGILWLTDSNAATDYKNWEIGSISGELRILRGNDALNSAQNAYKITGAATAGWVGEHIWYTNNGSERARIDNSGRLLVGTSSISSGDGQIYVQQDAISIRNLIALNNTGAGSTAAGIVAFYRQGTYTGGITNTNSSSAFVTSSDYRLKENITPLTNAADRLGQLKVRRFNFIADPDNTVDGFIAHEVQAVVPECVFGEKDAVDDEGNPIYQGIDQSKLVPLLTAALQEAMERIEVLEQRLTDAGIA